MTSPNLKTATFIGVVLIITMHLGLGLLPLVGPDEPRYVRIGQEMFQSGDYVTPTLNSRAWLEKPPLLFWIQAVTLHLFPASEWSARLPISLLAILTSLGCGYLLGSMVGSRVGLLAILVAATTPFFFVFSRAASTDLPLAAFLSLAMLSIYRGYQTGTLGWVILSALALALAVLSKGPVALILLIGTVISFWVLTGSFLLTLKQLIMGVVVFLAVSMPWFLLVWEANGQAFINTFWLNHHLARFITDVHHHSQPVWFYFPILLIGCTPWIVFAMANAWRNWTQLSGAWFHSKGVDLYLWVWVVVTVVFFSLSRSKLPGYVLPAALPVAFLAAIEVDRLLSEDMQSLRIIRRVVPVLVGGSFIIAILSMVYMIVTHGSKPMGIILAFPWVILVIGVWWAGYEPRKLLVALVISMTILAGLTSLVVAPEVGVFHSSKKLVQGIRQHLSLKEPLVFYRFFHHSALYYTDYKALPEAIENLADLRAYMHRKNQNSYWILTEKNGLEELQSAFETNQFGEGTQFLVEVKYLPDL